MFISGRLKSLLINSLQCQHVHFPKWWKPSPNIPNRAHRSGEEVLPAIPCSPRHSWINNIHSMFVGAHRSSKTWLFLTPGLEISGFPSNQCFIYHITNSVRPCYPGLLCGLLLLGGTTLIVFCRSVVLNCWNPWLGQNENINKYRP